MKKSFLLFLLCAPLAMAAQTNKTYSFTIKGKILHPKENFWSFGETDYLGNKRIDVPVRKDGTYEQIVPIEGMQNLFLYIRKNPITIYAQSNDTIEINWDANDVNRTFEIKSPNQTRHYELQKHLLEINKMSQVQIATQPQSRDSQNKEQIKYKQINDAYNQEIKQIVDTNRLSDITKKFTVEAYYKYTNQLLDNRLLGKYSLKIDSNIVQLSKTAMMFCIPQPDAYKTLNMDDAFYRSPTYRDFLYNYVRFGNKLFNGSYFAGKTTVYNKDGKGIQYSEPFELTKYYYNEFDNEDLRHTNFVLAKYYQAMAEISAVPVREWFITKSILDGFEYQSYEDAEEVLKLFLPTCKSTAYRDTLTTHYQHMQKLKSGELAPQFILTDEKGGSVSLSDFKGKLVYIDFWGVYCGPCRYAIKNHVPKLHEKYKDKNIVFVNICLDSEEKEWKKALDELKPDGINLISKASNKQLRNDYNVNGIPHYVLIDENGKLVTSTAPDPYPLINSKTNIIDQQLQRLESKTN